MYVNTYIIADAINKGNNISAEALQLQRDVAYNQELKDSFEDRVFAQEGIPYNKLTNLHKLIVKKVLLTDMLRIIS